MLLGRSARMVRLATVPYHNRCRARGLHLSAMAAAAAWCPDFAVLTGQGFDASKASPLVRTSRAPALYELDVCRRRCSRTALSVADRSTVRSIH